MYKADAITMGKSSPATVALDARKPGRSYGYLYRNDPSRTPDHPDYRPEAERLPQLPPSPDGNHQRRKERIAAFGTHYAELLPVLGKDAAIVEAGRRVDVGESTAKDYERILRRQEGEPS